MCGRIKSVEFLQFDFSLKTTQKTAMNCSYSFKAQFPVGTPDLVRALLVFFDADSEGDIVHFHAQCRVIFEFEKSEDIPNGDDFIANNYRAAYQAFCKKSNEALVILGQNNFEFKEI